MPIQTLTVGEVFVICDAGGGTVVCSAISDIEESNILTGPYGVQNQRAGANAIC